MIGIGVGPPRALLALAAALAVVALVGCGGEPSDETSAAAPEGPGDLCEWDTTGADTLLIWMDPDVPASAVEELGAVLAADPAVAELTYFDRDAAAEEFHELFADRPEMIDGVDTSMLPTSYRLVATSPDAVDDLVRRYDDTDGVDHVQTARAPEIVEQLCEDGAGNAAELQKNAEQLAAARFDSADLRVWLDPTRATRLDDIATQLDALDGVVQVRLISQSASWEEFRCLFTDDPRLLDGTSPQELPPSVLLWVTDGADHRAEVRSAASELDGIDRIQERPRTGDDLTWSMAVHHIVPSFEVDGDPGERRVGLGAPPGCPVESEPLPG